MAPAPEPIDWRLAERVAVAVAGAGPALEAGERGRLRRDFDESTRVADGLVRSFTGLDAAPAVDGPTVLDRAGWIRINLEGFRELLRPVGERLGSTGGLGRRVLASAFGLQMGALFGYLAQRVLGQYDLLFAQQGDGRVLFVGPNVIAAERRGRFAPADFRMWLTLHEVTHRTQFVGVPWLADTVRSLSSEYLSAIDLDAARAREIVRRLADLLRQGPEGWRKAHLFTLFLSPRQQAIVLRMQALMSVVEGHGNFVMNRLGALHVPSHGRMKRAMAQRRSDAGAARRALEKALGIDLKLQQYAVGEAFVTGVAERAGDGALTRLWEREENLPTMEEVRDSEAWLRRMGLGHAGSGAAEVR